MKLNFTIFLMVFVLSGLDVVLGPGFYIPRCPYGFHREGSVCVKGETRRNAILERSQEGFHQDVPLAFDTQETPDSDSPVGPSFGHHSINSQKITPYVHGVAPSPPLGPPVSPFETPVITNGQMNSPSVPEGPSVRYPPSFPAGGPPGIPGSLPEMGGPPGVINAPSIDLCPPGYRKTPLGQCKRLYG